jgi:hypothetical protein
VKLSLGLRLYDQKEDSLGRILRFGKGKRVLHFEVEQENGSVGFQKPREA